VSIKSTPICGSRFKVRIASGRSAGSSQMPGPVTRIAPKPRRWTAISPPILKVPDFAALRLDMAKCLSFEQAGTGASYNVETPVLPEARRYWVDKSFRRWGKFFE